MNFFEVDQEIRVSTSTCKQVALSIIGNKSNATKKAAIKSSLGIAEKINNSLLTTEEFIKTTDISIFMAFADELSLRRRKSWSYRITVAPFKGLWLWAIAYLFDLNFSALLDAASNQSPDYFEVGDGIVLAGLYLYLKDQEG